jgi:hypothetical protein
MKLDELVFDGKEDRCMARGDIQYATDGSQVGIAESSCHQQQHFHLPLAQVVWRGGRRNLLRVHTGTCVSLTQTAVPNSIAHVREPVRATETLQMNVTFAK